ncbi:hypothetical protein ERO13_D06G056600v2 [Gossypium hirsutum]|uniref:Uncharacterized protein n=7 Tax=Gossypium TaxID=3633 RepID=A0A0D2R382_GOSRA|nr:uncharacterized protein LOC107901187 [Gossypium hirsutum]XP_052487926.1 uncharacterized protein LOC105773750 [Gossypium raimondii]KAB2024135.1 hypothetical protein ES319_D06G066600v1 [Gossypium barbadense]MBA0626016.1 hypothetical protein [Gossypium davidsonii]MBA0661604.1 hypothetical protein [Gossypium klotzschianum]MBA0838794.1 hypothetical protein [Gossypium armourianum]TYG63984.1 hypothetical protein ES288_D06G072100v1 [Gossypium darwinii]
MATHLFTFRPARIHASAIPAHLKPDSDRRRTTTLSTPTNWWAPLFGLPSDPDYIDSDNKTELKQRRQGESLTDVGQKWARTKFSPARFTEDKARQLRMMTTTTSSFHDIMYHSAIASRLASDFKDR